MDKLKYAVGESGCDADFNTIEIAYVADKEHAEQGYGTAHWKMIFDIGCYKGKGQCNACKGQLLCIDFSGRLLFVRDKSSSEYDQN